MDTQKRFVVMESHVGNGRVVHACDFKEAFIAFQQNEVDGVMDREEVRRLIEREWPHYAIRELAMDHHLVGDYGIKEVGTA